MVTRDRKKTVGVKKYFLAFRINCNKASWLEGDFLRPYLRVHFEPGKINKTQLINIRLQKRIKISMDNPLWITVRHVFSGNWEKITFWDSRFFCKPRIINVIRFLANQKRSFQMFYFLNRQYIGLYLRG